METLLFCTSYLSSSPHCAAERWRKWIEYYSQRMELFGADRLVLIDDGSSLEDIQLPVTILSADRLLPSELPQGVVLFRFEQHLGRSSMYHFPGWWRSFSFASEVARIWRVGKLIHIESDAYVISRRLADYIRDCDQGWTTFYQAHYRSRFARVLFPRDTTQSRWASLRMKGSYVIRPVPLAESALQVICGDEIASLRQLWQRGVAYWGLPLLAEQELPFTHMERRFVGDRYGEFGYQHYPTDVDFISQARAEWCFDGELMAERKVVAPRGKAL